MNALLARLRRQGLEIWVEGDKVRYRGPAESLAELDLSELKARKGEVVAFLGPTRRLGGMPPLLAKARPATIPLSVVQRGWLEMQRRGLRVVPHCMTMDLRLSGPLSLVALKAALEKLILRHEILRTRYEIIGSDIEQSLSPEAVYQFEIARAAASDGDDDMAGVYAKFSAFKASENSAFDDSLIQFLIISLSDTDNVLGIKINSAAIDNASCFTFVAELFEFYAAEIEARPPQLPAVRLQYADFAVWESEWLRDDDGRVDVSHWRHRLASTSAIELPTVAPRPTEASEMQRFEIPFAADQDTMLRTLARQEGVTVPMVLLALFCSVLAVWSRQDRFAIGLMVNGRTPGVEGMLGAFARVQPFLMDFSTDPTFQQALESARFAFAEANSLRHPIDLDTILANQLFRVVVSIDRREAPRASDEPRAPTAQPPLRLTVNRFPPPLGFIRVGREDLHLSVVESPMGISGVLHASHAIGAENTRWLISQFRALLTGDASHLHQSLKSLVRPPGATARDPLSEDEKYIGEVQG